MDLVISPPSGDLSEAFARFAGLLPRSRTGRLKLDLPSGAVELPMLDLDSRRVVLLSCVGVTDHLPAILKKHRPSAFDEEGVSEILVATESDVPPFRPMVVGLGIKAVPLHDAVAVIAGLPPVWHETQGHFTSMTLEPVKMGGAYRTAKMRLLGPGGAVEAAPAQDWVDEQLAGGTIRDQLIYVRAEAGKGKST